MCLNILNKLTNTSGYAVKCVRKTNRPDEFKPYWPMFSLGGGGGRGKNTKWTTNQRKDLVTARVIYKLGRTYRVKHSMIAKTDNYKMEYPALVHCYVNLRRSVFEHGTSDPEREHLLVKYSGGQYTDSVSLTAKYITPIAVLKGTTLDKFRAMENKRGFEATVQSFLAAQVWLED
jgi:hypothetical protein